MGIKPAVAAKVGRYHPPFGVARIERLNDGYYQPGDGPSCVISPVFEDGELIDLVAWQTSNPSSWLFRKGLGWALGSDCLKMRWDCEPAVRVHATPLDWWRGDCEGICILDWAAPEIRDLSLLEAIEAEPWIAAKLRQVLSAPPRMPIIISNKGMRHAA